MSAARLNRCTALYGKTKRVAGDVHKEESPDNLWREPLRTERYDLQALVVALGRVGAGRPAGAWRVAEVDFARRWRRQRVERTGHSDLASAVL